MSEYRKLGIIFKIVIKMPYLFSDGTILVTSYSMYNIEHKKLLNVNWHYAILDEGHKIRNPNAKVSLPFFGLKTF